MARWCARTMIWALQNLWRGHCNTVGWTCVCVYKGTWSCGISSQHTPRVSSLFYSFQVMAYHWIHNAMFFALVKAGISIHGIHNIMNKKQTSCYYRQKLQFQNLSGNISAFPSIEKWQHIFSSSIPSQHAISGCFLAEFWWKEVYTKFMQNTTISDQDAWLSCDYTFASATELVVFKLISGMSFLFSTR